MGEGLGKGKAGERRITHATRRLFERSRQKMIDLVQNWRFLEKACLKKTKMAVNSAIFGCALVGDSVVCTRNRQFL
jgi:hypothetical protein